MQNLCAPNPKVVQMQARSDPAVYVRLWLTPLHKTCCASPGYCCFSLWCPCCASWQLRKQALYGDLTRYICCNGACPCSGRCGEQNCPACCLCMETFCCFGMSVATTRYMVQDELRIQTSACDNCIIGTMIALQYIACICHIVACITGSGEVQALAQIVDLLADVAWCTVCSCMQTQHHVELDERDKGTLGAGGRPAMVMAPAPQMIAMGTTYPGPPPANYQGQGGAGPSAYNPPQAPYVQGKPDFSTPASKQQQQGGAYPAVPSAYPPVQQAYR